MKLLYLALKNNWYDMIESGIKKEEYRELNTYWRNRLVCKGYTHVIFRRAYTKKIMIFEIDGISIGKGYPEWGAPDKAVYIIKIGKRIEL